MKASITVVAALVASVVMPALAQQPARDSASKECRRPGNLEVSAMTDDRRQFLRHSLFVLGSVATGGAIGRQSSCAGPAPRRGRRGDDAAAPWAGPAHTDGPATPALTVDHRLAHRGGDAHAQGGGPLPADRLAARKGIPGRKFVMVIDLAKCDGCGACQTACSKMHFIPPTRQYIKVLRMQDSEYTAPYFFPQPCFQCDNPPCTKVCPVDATFKRDDGIVLIDNERCIGCRFCMAACPYGARSFNWEKPSDPPGAAAQPIRPRRDCRTGSAPSRNATSAPIWRPKASSPPAPAR